MDRGPATRCPRVLCIYTIFIYIVYMKIGIFGIYLNISLSIYLYIHTYIYIYREREREGCIPLLTKWTATINSEVGVFGGKPHHATVRQRARLEQLGVLCQREIPIKLTLLS